MLSIISYGMVLISCNTNSTNQSSQNSTSSIQEWIQVGDYDVFVHEFVSEQDIVNGDRLAYIEVEYANNRSAEELSCRRNQWYLYDDQGYSYEAENDWYNDEFGGKLYEITDLHYLGGEHYLSQNMQLRGWLIFIIPENANIVRVQFMTAFLDTKTADILINETK